MAENVVFNGNFEQGKTLYSNWYNGVNQTYAKDAYPVRGEQYCTTQKICVEYNYHYEKICTRFDYRGRCSIYKSVKVYDYSSCKTYQTKTTCTNTQNYPAICYNPSGTYTNQLELRNNFFYSFDGVNWIQVPYSYTNFNNKNIIFKVVIPSICRPNYEINKAIVIA